MRSLLTAETATASDARGWKGVKPSRRRIRLRHIADGLPDQAVAAATPVAWCSKAPDVKNLPLSAGRSSHRCSRSCQMPVFRNDRGLSPANTELDYWRRRCGIDRNKEQYHKSPPGRGISLLEPAMPEAGEPYRDTDHRSGRISTARPERRRRGRRRSFERMVREKFVVDGKSGGSSFGRAALSPTTVLQQ